jgi:phosphoribosyl-ATP pyrophosphohydrolase/phosphoribosyl-AMP cyclohydrolase/histidinol dehydrogenase
MKVLRERRLDDLAAGRIAVPDEATMAEARRIVDDVRERGLDAVLDHAHRLGDLQPGERGFWDPGALADERDRLSAAQRDVLERTATRIRAFADAQRGSLHDLTMAIPGGRVGHTIAPVERAGCYAPGGRFPLPSSVLMTVVTANAAGVASVWVASPRPAPVTLAAAAIAGADGLLAIGGAQAIAALAFGVGPVAPCDVIAGPGNRWVMAAKQLVAGRLGVDLVAGPSELVVVADAGADPDTVASDLLAQAEHDPDAIPVLVTTDRCLARDVDRAICTQLDALATAVTARAALANGGVVLVSSREEAVEACNRLAPEHLELVVEDAQALVPALRHYGALFIGAGAGEVLGDYGAGPNHVLPTGGAARFSGGLSVFTFLRVRTWLAIDEASSASPLVRDAVALARMEGLVAHAASAARRLAG